MRRVRSADILALVALALCVAPAARAEPADTDPISASQASRNKAQARFIRGRDLFVAKKYPQALTEFRSSLEIVASPNARLYVARCLREMGELIDAYAELERTEADGKALGEKDPRYAQTALSASEEKAELKKSLAFVTFSIKNATSATTLKLGNEEIQPEAWKNVRLVMPGTVEVTVETPPDPPKKQTLKLAGGDSKTIDIEAVAPPPPPPEPVAGPTAPQPRAGEKLRPLAYVAAGVGAAGVVSFLVAGAMANAKYSGLKSDCNDGPCPASRAGDIAVGRAEQTVANIGLVVGLVGIAASTTLFIVSAPGADKTGPQASVVVGPGWLGIRGAM